MALQVEYVNTDTLRPYENNAKQHTAKQIEQLKQSIQQFGFNDPVGVWHDTVIEGHGRLIAATELGMKQIPIIRLDGLTDDERRAYMIAHNKIAMNTGFNNDLLSMELQDLTEKFDFTELGFGDFELSILLEDMDPEPYDQNVIDQYSGNEEDYLAKRRVIITYVAEKEDLVKELLGLEEIKKVVYDIDEIEK